MVMMLSVQQIEFVNLVLESMMEKDIKDYMGLGEIERSALTEVGNIMISTFINALSGLANLDIKLTDAHRLPNEGGQAGGGVAGSDAADLFQGIQLQGTELVIAFKAGHQADGARLHRRYAGGDYGRAHG